MKRQGYFTLDLGNIEPKKIKTIELNFNPPKDNYAKPKGNNFKITLNLK